MALSLAPTVALAVGGIELSVGACPGNPDATGLTGYIPTSCPSFPVPGDDPPCDPAYFPADGGATIDCASGQSFVLLATWSPAQNLPDLVGLDGLLDFRVAGSDLDASPFWNLDPLGCGSHGVSVSRLRPAVGCTSPEFTDLWNDPGGGEAWAAIRRGVSVGRLAFTAYRSTLISVTAGQSLFGIQIAFDLSAATESGGSCAGCCTRFEIAWISGKPGTAGSPASELSRSSNAYPGITQAMAFQGSPAACSGVQVRSSSWGKLKSLYR